MGKKRVIISPKSRITFSVCVPTGPHSLSPRSARYRDQGCRRLFAGSLKLQSVNSSSQNNWRPGKRGRSSWSSNCRAQPPNENHSLSHVCKPIYISPNSLTRKIEAYSHIFEVIATREAWEKERWAQVLAPFLMGDAQRAYNSLQRPQSEDYEALKSEILAHVGLSPVFAAEHFQQWTYDEHLLI